MFKKIFKCCIPDKSNDLIEKVVDLPEPYESHINNPSKFKVKTNNLNLDVSDEINDNYKQDILTNNLMNISSNKDFCSSKKIEENRNSKSFNDENDNSFYTNKLSSEESEIKDCFNMNNKNNKIKRIQSKEKIVEKLNYLKISEKEDLQIKNIIRSNKIENKDNDKNEKINNFDEYFKTVRLLYKFRNILIIRKVFLLTMIDTYLNQKKKIIQLFY